LAAAVAKVILIDSPS